MCALFVNPNMGLLADTCEAQLRLWWLTRSFTLSRCTPPYAQAPQYRHMQRQRDVWVSFAMAGWRVTSAPGGAAFRFRPAGLIGSSQSIFVRTFDGTGVPPATNADGMPLLRDANSTSIPPRDRICSSDECAHEYVALVLSAKECLRSCALKLRMSIILDRNLRSIKARLWRPGSRLVQTRKDRYAN